MKLNSYPQGNIWVVDICGELAVGQSTKVLRDTSKRVLEADGLLMVFNMLEVPWLDSAGIGEVVACHKRARDRGGRIKLVVQGKSRELFLLYELDKVLEMFADLDAALASFPGDGANGRA